MSRKTTSSKRTREQNKKIEEKAVFIVRPVSKRFGLDYLHLSLIILVLILIALSLSLSYFKPSKVVQTCPYGIVNNTCATLKYNSAAAIKAAERILASYSTINTSLSLLPYYSLVNESKAIYLVNNSKWLVIIPYVNPFTKEIINTSMLLYASNLSLAEPFMQMIKPITYTNNSVVAPGTIEIQGKVACPSNTSIPVYLITDPYAPGALQSISKAINTTKAFNGKVNMSYKFIFSSYSIHFYNTYGVQTTQALGMYLACASQQPNFTGFVSNLSKIFSGNPVSNYTLHQVAVGSKLNMSKFNSCIQHAPTLLDYQAKLAQYYNITSTPTFVVGCKYLSIPETLNESIAYALKNK